MNVVLGMRSNGFVDAFLSWSPQHSLGKGDKAGAQCSWAPAIFSVDIELPTSARTHAHAHTHTLIHTPRTAELLCNVPVTTVWAVTEWEASITENTRKEVTTNSMWEGAGGEDSPGKRALQITGSRARSDRLCDPSLHPTFYHFPTKPCLSAFGETQTWLLLLNELTVRWRGFKPQLGH